MSGERSGFPLQNAVCRGPDVLSLIMQFETPQKRKKETGDRHSVGAFLGRTRFLSPLSASVEFLQQPMYGMIFATYQDAEI
jgi:hypothetical protein